MRDNYEATVQEGKIVAVTVNGKPVKAGYMRGLRKAQTTRYFVNFCISGTFANPLSGETFVLNPLETTIYAWCVEWYARYKRYWLNPEKWEVPVQTYDDMKEFFRFLNPAAYMGLID